MPPHNDPNDPHDHPAPSGPTGTTGSSGSSGTTGTTGSSGPTGTTGTTGTTIPQTGATFSTDSEFSAVITESNAAQTVTGKINVDDPDAGQACLDLARTLGYSTTSDYYKTGEATRTGSYYGSKTIFTLLSNNQLAVISDGDPYPAEAGAGDNLNNNLISTRFPGSIIEQDFEYKFTYRGGNLNSDASYSDFFSASAMGIQGIFLNGVALYNPSSGNGTVPNTTISGNNSYNLNAAFFDAQYGIDEAGGHPSPQGNVVNGTTGQYHYHDAMFLTSGLWNNETFVSSNAYFSSDYYTDASGNIDYIRHTNGHSKIVGFCFDGYPIYGSYGYDASFNPQSNAVLMTSSYRTLDEAFYGRPYAYDASLFGYTLSAGAFLDDYEYVPGMGSLDDCNGRFCVTPEYPNGTYAYFVLINEENKAVFPYIIGKYSRQQRKVINAGYPADTHDTGGSVIPTTGTEGVFNVSTLGVSKYVSSPINETIVDVSYGSFTIDSSGNWSYTMDGPHDEFVTDVSYNDSIRVYSYDGSANRLVTVTMMGTAEAPSGPTPTPLDANNTDSQCVMYSLNSPAAGEATVSGYSGSATAIVIPAQVVSSDGTSYTVTNMDISFFQSINCSSLTIPASVTHIHPFNVGRASTLTNVIVDSANPYYMVKDGLLYKLYTESGNNYATVWGGFNDPTISNTVTINSVTKGSVTYPVTSIHVDQAPLMFWGATAVIFGDNVTSLGNGDAFHSNIHIVSMTMGANITSIQFRDIQSQFTTLSIGANVTSIASSVFSSITSLTVDPDNTTFKVQDGIFYQKVDAANATIFKVFGTVTNVVIPATIEIGGGEGIPVTSIPDWLFSDRTSLTAVSIGNNVSYIGSGAFNNTRIVSISIPASVTVIEFMAFSNNPSLISVTFAANSQLTTLRSALFDNTNISTINIPNSVVDIQDGVFNNCLLLRNVTIPYSVTSMRSNTFSGCALLTDLAIDSANTTYVEQDGVVYQKVDSANAMVAFGLFSLTSANMPSSVSIDNASIPVTSIGEGAFQDCSKLTAVTIPDAVTSIGLNAFRSCSALTAVTIPDAVTTIGQSAFTDCTALTAVTIGASVTTIGNEAFTRCYNVSTVTIPASVTYIGSYAFIWCGYIQSVYFLGDNTDNRYFDKSQFHFRKGTDPANSWYYPGYEEGWDSYVSSAPWWDPNVKCPPATAYYIDGKDGWSQYASPNTPPIQFASVTTFVPEGSDSAPNHSSGPLTVDDGAEIGNVSGGNVTVLSGTADVNSTTGAFAMDLTTGNAVVTTLNGSGSAFVSIGSGKSLSTSAGTFAGALSGAGTLKKTGSDTLTLSGTNSGFSGAIQVTDGTLKAPSAASLGSGAIQLGDGLAYNGANVTLVIESTTADETVSNPIQALSAGFNNLSTGSGTRVVTLTGGVTKNATILRLLGSFVVDSNITGSSANSDLLLGDGTTSSADVTLVSGNTYNYNGPTTVNTGSTLTLQDGVALPDSDVTINAGATLELEYTTSTITANSVNSLTLSGATTVQSNAGIEGGKLIVNISSNLTAGDYTVLAVNTYGATELSGSQMGNPIQVNYTGSNGSSASITQDSNCNFVVTITAPPTPTSNVCFPAKTPIMTNLGPVNIEDINPAVHTIRNKKIVAITKTVAHDKNLVRIAKHALGHLYPEKTTLISQNHKVFCQGQMIKAKHLVDEVKGVTFVPYNGQVLYNVLLEQHEKMQVNNLIVETLHPEHKVAKLYRFLKNVDAAHHGKFIAAFNKKDIEQRLHR